MLTYQPRVGSVVYCDYAGFVVPEMIKRRPVIVISKHRQNSRLVGVVPISTTIKEPVLGYQVEMDKNFCAEHLAGKRSWVKCDMFNVVSLHRLNLVRDKRLGIRHAPSVSNTTIATIKQAIRKAHDL